MTKERLTIMISPELRAQLQRLADRDERSLGEMLAICARHGMALVEKKLDAADSVQEV